MLCTGTVSSYKERTRALEASVDSHQISRNGPGRAFGQRGGRREQHELDEACDGWHSPFSAWVHGSSADARKLSECALDTRAHNAPHVLASASGFLAVGVGGQRSKSSPPPEGGQPSVGDFRTLEAQRHSTKIGWGYRQRLYITEYLHLIRSDLDLRRSAAGEGF